MLINISNHPSDKWSEEQKKAAYNEFGEVLDLDFPDIDPVLDIVDLKKLAKYKYQNYIEFAEDNDDTRFPVAFHIMGEMTFSFALINLLLKSNYRCIASTTERIAKIENNIKTQEFKFRRFRDYKL